MTKTTLINDIEQMNITDDLKQGLLEKLSSYPNDELSQEEMLDFDSFLAELQEEELETGMAMEEMADSIDSYLNDLANAEEEASKAMVKRMHDTLEAMQIYSNQ